MAKIKFCEIEKFKGIDANIDIEDIVLKYGEKAVEQLKANSPSDNKVRLKKRKGKYKDTWTTRNKIKDDDVESMVWNDGNWQLTHLLEHGHQIVNKRGGVGWASMKPHIKPTYDKLKPKFIKEMKNVDIELNFK